MKHYSREHERGQSRIAELERRKNTCEAGLAAISACWSQVGSSLLRNTIGIVSDMCYISPARRDHTITNETGRFTSSFCHRSRYAIN